MNIIVNINPFFMKFLQSLSVVYRRNLGWKDRLIRVAIVLVMIGAWHLGYIGGIFLTIAGIVALMLLGTAASGSCPANYLLNINTMSEKEKSKLRKKGIKFPGDNLAS
jgi:hypothetical protein